MTLAKRVSYADKYGVRNYRHVSPLPRDNVYRVVRMHLGLSQNAIAKMFGVSRMAWMYRERTKRMYRIAELRALRELSGLDAETFIQLLDDCA